MGKKKVRKYFIERKWCKGCGICVAKNVLQMDEFDKPVPVRAEDCVACRLCEMRCPDLAIEIVAEDIDEGKAQ